MSAGGVGSATPFDDLAGVRSLLEARGATIGRPLHLVRSTGSTNDDARRGAREGAPHGSTWVANEQTKGRGRQGRAWVAPPGSSLLVSVLLRLGCPPARLPRLSLVAGLAARDALAPQLPADHAVRVKWPNDVVVGPARKKIAGVLVEASLVGERVDALVVGVGINVHTSAFPPELAGRATSIALEDGDADRARVLDALLAGLEREMPRAAEQGLAPVIDRLLAVDALAGARVRRDDGAAGTAEGIDLEGHLRVRRDDGSLAAWGAGEVHLLP